MQPGLKKFLASWAINTLAVLLTVSILRGHIRYAETSDLFVASLLLGILNAFIRPVLLLLTLPLLIFSLGLFTIVINGCLLYLVHAIMGPHFVVDSVGWAMLGALIISIISMILNIMTGVGNARIRVQRPNRPPDGGDKGGSGPVIDV